jgi:E3 SUMO-protein ligase RanBP2
MQSTQEKVMKDIMECNKSLLETNRVLATELKENRHAMQQMKVKLDELSRTSNRGGGVPPTPVPAATVPLAYYPPDYLAYAQGGQFMPPPPFPAYDTTGRLPASFAVPPQSQPIPTVPIHRDQSHVIEDEEDYEDDVYDAEDDYGNENIPSSQFPVKDSELIQEWPYGNITSLEGKSTIAYTPPRPMPGPGFFSQRPTGAQPGFAQTAGLVGPPPSQHFPSPAAVSGASITMGTSSAGQFMTRTPASGPPPNAVLGTPIAPRPGFPVPTQPGSMSVSANFEYPVPLIASGASPTSQGTNVPNLVSMIAAKTGSPMFAAKPTTEDATPKKEEKNLSYKADGEQEPTYSDPHFEPIMDLPEEIVQMTGEEEETVLYQSERTRLYRFSETQWKERGTGTAKILSNETTGKVRFLMRREQVLKICANHFFRSGMTISPMTGSKNAYMWFASDFAEEEMKNEKFALKFKTEQMASEFKEKFLEAVQLVEACVPEPKTPTTQAPASSTAQKSEDALQKLRLKVGEWECDVCMIKNKADATNCAACTTPKPGSAPAPASSTPASSTPAWTGASGIGGFTMTPKSDSSGISFGMMSTATPGFKFGAASFGAKKDDVSTSAEPATTTTTSQMGFKFGQDGGGFKFGSNAALPMFGQHGASPAGSPASSLLSEMASKHQEDTKKPTPVSTSGGKTNVGGFSFVSPPKLKPACDDPQIVHVHAHAVKGKSDVAVAKTDAPNPFAGFSFGSKPPMLTNLILGTDEKEKEKSSPAPIIGGNSAPVSFADLSKKATSTPSFGKPTEKAVPVTKPATASVAASSEKPHDVLADESHPEGYVPTGDYQPIIQLPQLVDVQTGEEEEKKLFAERAKLYRYDAEAKQWKERGIGTLKIMKNLANGKGRVLMRREQVLKLCANHIITPAMNLVKMNASNNAWCWTAHDYAEEAHQLVKLAVKFKTQEMAANFKEIFEACQNEFVAQEESEEQPEDLSMKPKAEPEGDLYANLRPPEGSWSCDACLLSNASGLTKCAACLTPKPGTKVEESKPVFKIGGTGGFTFGGSSSEFSFGSKPQSGSEKPAEKKVTKEVKPVATEVKPLTSEEIAAMFKVAEGSWTCDTCMISNGPDVTQCLACETTKPGSEKESSGAQGHGTSSQAAAGIFNSGGGFKFTGGSGGFAFGSKPAPAILEASSTQKSGFAFGSKLAVAAETVTTTSTGNKGFSFGTQLAEPVTTQSKGFTFGSMPAPAIEQVSQPAGVELVSKSTPEVSSSQPAASANSEDPLEKLRLKVGEWECDVCMIKNKADATKCAACTTPKPGSAPAPASSTPAWIGASGIGGFTMTPKSDSSGCSFGATPKTGDQKSPDGGFKFGQTSTPKSASTLSSGFNFGAAAAASGFKFGSTSPSLSTPKSSTQEPTTPDFKFGTTKTFAFTGVTPSAASTSKSYIKSPKSPDDHYQSEEDDSHLDFEPIIPLPEKIEVKTGEEDEKSLFTHRTKLFRWQKDEWKERGLGNISFLEHIETGRIRIIMRREQILKLCCNHNLTGDLKLLPMEKANGKAYLWYAMDFTDGEPKPEQFCVRFKTKEIADEFAKIFRESNDKMKGFKSPQKSGAQEIEVSKADTSVANSSTASDFSFKVDDNSIKDAKMPEGFSFKSPELTSKSNFSFGDRFRTPATETSPLIRSKETSQAGGGKYKKLGISVLHMLHSDSEFYSRK